MYFQGHFTCIFRGISSVFSGAFHLYFQGHFICIFRGISLVFSEAFHLYFQGHFTCIFRGIPLIFSGAFHLYDLDNDGFITKEEMVNIVDAIYCMVGDVLDLPVDEDTPQKRVDKIFAQMDTVRV